MKKLLSIGLVVLGCFVLAQNLQINKENIKSEIAILQYNPDFVPFDTENRIFYKSTIYQENEFERTYEWGKNHVSTAKNMGNAAAFGLLRGSFFVLGKIIECALTPKEKVHYAAQNSDDKNRKKGIRR